MNEKKTTGGGWDKATELFDKAKQAAATGAKKAQGAAQVGVEKARQTMDDMEKKVQDSKATKVASGGWDSAVESVGYVPSDDVRTPNSNLLVDPSEQITATIGSNYLQNFLSGGPVEKSVGVLTQKRFYYKGRNFSGTGKDTKSATEEGIVSIEDITFTKFTHFRHTGFLVFAILLTIAAIPLFAMASYFAVMAMVSLAAAIPFYILYFVKRQTLFLVSFPGGGFAFDIRWYPISDIRDFQRQLHLMKDHAKEEAAI